MAFFLESTFVGLFFFGWDKMKKQTHLLVTLMVALGSNISALWILVANGWMAYPIGAHFNYQTLRMELTSFYDLFFNPVSQVKFVHTVGAGYVTAAMFVLAVSSYYILRGRDLAFARRSFAVAAGFGLASILSVIVLGDQSGFVTGEVQKVKLAAMEAEWETEPPPAGFTVFGMPDQEEQRTRGEVKIPWLGGIIVTRSLDTPVIGVKDLIAEGRRRIESGMVAYAMLEKMRAGDRSDTARIQFEQHKDDLGYGLLLKRFTSNIVDATDAQIDRAAKDTIPDVALMFWTFRIMVGLGFWMLGLIAVSFYYCARRLFHKKRWLLWLLVFNLPVPWIAAEMGWFVAEYGRQPWTIGEVLPTYLSASSLNMSDVIGSLIGLVVFYTVLLAVELFLMVKFVRLGPSSLHTGRYHFEQQI
jgi:cytochrome d ubiquinol oxidase subunit I